MSIRVELIHGYQSTRIVGYVDDREIITLSNQIFGKWSTGSSTCLPSDIIMAAEYLECMRQAFATMESLEN